MDSLSFIPLGGIGDVTKNMYLYEYGNEILIVDCGLGFPRETMLGVSLLLPDVTYLQHSKKRIVGLVLTHGHEDHIGGLPFILPQLKQNFPIFGTPLTAAFANKKLSEFSVKTKVMPVSFGSQPLSLGRFKTTFISVTHSVPDTSHIFIETPVGNFYHGSDFKFDDTPYDGRRSDYSKIEEVGRKGITCLMTDCLGSERAAKQPSESTLLENFKREAAACRGKFLVTTYSSNIARINQIIEASESVGRKVSFLGRSLSNTIEAAGNLGYLKAKEGTLINIEEARRYPDNKLTLIVAGSQGQENSALVRISNGDSKDVKIKDHDTVVFSSDPIPGYEIAVYELIDTLSRRGAKVLYTGLEPRFHVSGHGSSEELEKLLKLTNPRKIIPIGGNFRHMVSYTNMAQKAGYNRSDVILLDDGQEVIFAGRDVKRGKLVPVKNVYVDEVSGEEVESYVLRDRQKLSESGIVIVICEIDSVSGKLAANPDVLIRGFALLNKKKFDTAIANDIRSALGTKKARVTNWSYVRSLVEDQVARRIFKQFRKRPLVIPVVMEV